MTMKRGRIVITQSDFEKLERLLSSPTAVKPHDEQHRQALAEELDGAIVVAEGDVPDDVLTMNSRARVRDLTTRREFECQIVLPGKADPGKNRISVLAPIGTALLGYRAGDTVEWPVPAGLRRLRILAVEYQPKVESMAA